MKKHLYAGMALCFTVGAFNGYYYARAQLFAEIMGNTVSRLEMLPVSNGGGK